MPSRARLYGDRSLTSRSPTNTFPLVGSCSPVMTLNSVVLPAPFGPIRPVICPSRADRRTSVSAWMPPKFTETSTTSRTACGSRRPVPSAAANSVAGADKGPLLLEEDGRGRSLRRDGAVGGLRPPHAAGVPSPSRPLRDPAADAVRVAADADRRDAGEQELVLQERRQVRQEG